MIEGNGGQIRVVDIQEQVKAAYLDYAMSVITARALPDVRDGLKPVQRRILHGMLEAGVRANSRHKKSASVVGDVMKKYHPHGDAAIYDALARMAQPWNMRYPLVDGQGNFGSVDGDPPAAMRYTEVRLSPLAEEMLADIDRDTVEFVENYDGEYREPVVLPAKVPNLLLNGASGIAVGMATNIPPHNLVEIGQAVQLLIDRWDELEELTTDDLLEIVHGPDFPTGGFILGREGIRQAYATGKGRVVMRAKAHMDELKGGKAQIVVTELPFQVNKAALIEKIAELVREKRIADIADLRDESDRRGMAIVIELKRGTQPRKVLNQLLKFTPMQTTFGVNTLALVDGEPRMLPLKRILQLFVQHRQEVLTRRTRFELSRAEERAHILEGLLVALKHLDEVIQTIRQARDAEHARQELIRKLALSEAQAQAILDMQLRRLAALERRKIEEEYEEIIKRIAYLQDLLANPRKILFLIRDEITALAERFGDERRTLITDSEDHEFNEEDFIAEEDVLVTITRRGYIKRVPAHTFRAQRRGGKGITGTVTRDEDEVEHIFLANSHDTIFYFSDQGRVYATRCYEVPDASRTARGLPLANLILLEGRERVTTCVTVSQDEFERDLYLTMGTRKGRIKRTPLADFAHIRSTGIICMGLGAGDELGWARLCSEQAEVVMVSQQGQAIRFRLEDTRPMGRPAGGVIGMRLARQDRVVAMDLASDGEELLTVTERGYGKRSALGEYPLQGRGGQGVLTVDPSRLKETGAVAAAAVVSPGDDVTFISTSGILIRVPVENILRLGRATRGGVIMRLRKGDSIASAARLRAPA